MVQKEGDFVSLRRKAFQLLKLKKWRSMFPRLQTVRRVILYKDGDEVPVTKVIAYILKEGEG
jgi:hypothetical protein